MVIRQAREYGDFQTPLELARSVVEAVARRGPFSAVLEPTCGAGSFIRAAGERLGLIRVTGIEIQPGHAAAAAALRPPTGCRFEIIVGDIYRWDIPAWARTQPDGRLLAIGNPPWVTNAELGGLQSANLPTKRNLKNLPGLAAMTGESNFDIAECIILQVAASLSGRPSTVSMLCKETVARNIFQFAARNKWPIAHAEIRRIDAQAWFGASVAACLLTFDLQPGTTWECEADVYPSLEADEPSARTSYKSGASAEDIKAYESVAYLDGSSPIEWRQGVKHDAARVLVLTRTPGGWENAAGERVEVEGERVFPLLRGGPLQKQEWPPQQRLVMPQFSVGEQTGLLKVAAPRTWHYLVDYAEVLDKRGSSIYRDRPRFSIFGVGPYTFSPWKVAFSSLYRRPTAIAIGSECGRPVVFDDTCYLLPTDNDGALATVVAALLNHPLARAFLSSVSNPTAKRTLTKRTLRRLDWLRLAEELDWAELCVAAESPAYGDDAIELRTIAMEAEEPLGGWLKGRLAAEAGGALALF